MTDQEFEDLRRVFEAVLPRADLDALLRAELEIRLDRLVAPELPYPMQVSNMIRAAEVAGWLPELVRAVVRTKRDDPEVAAWARRSGTAVALEPLLRTGFEAVVSPTGSKTTEAVVRPLLKNLTPEVWREHLTRLAGQICRIEIGFVPEGTGFLVGPDVILTSSQVVDWVLLGRRKPQDVRIRLDYLPGPKGAIAEGWLVELSTEWLIDYAPFGTVPPDWGLGNDSPAADELGYALLRLAQPVGSEPGASPTGWVQLPEAALDIRPETAVIVPHYAGDQSLKLVLGTIAAPGQNENGTRLDYDIDTGYVSAGAPCFDPEWNLLAVHQTCFPGFGRLSARCQGTPVSAIRARLARADLLGVLGKKAEDKK